MTLSIGLVSAHYFGEAALNGVLASNAYRRGAVQLRVLVRAPKTLAQPLVGPRWTDFQAFETQFQVTLTPSMPRLSEPGIQEHLRTCDLVLVAGWPWLITTSPYEESTLIGLHPTVLPQGRGLSPVSRSVLNGVPDVGVSAFLLRDRADSGPLVGVSHEPAHPRESALSVYGKALRHHARLARETVDTWALAALRPVPQDDERATRWRRVTAEEELLRPERTIDENLRTYRSLRPPYQGARVHDEKGRVIFATPSMGKKPSGLRELQTSDGSMLILLVDDETYTRIAARSATMADSILDPEPSSVPSSRSVDRGYSGAVLVTRTGTILLQKRDNKPNITNPGMITLFGGVVDGGESHTDCILRELLEELELDLAAEDLTELGYMDKAERDGSVTRCALFLANVPNPKDLTLHEGAAIEERSITEFLQEDNISAVCRAALEATAHREL